MKSKTVEAVSYKDRLAEDLKNPSYAAVYINAALEDADDPDVLKIALRDVAEVRGIAAVARGAGVNRVSIYKALAPEGNPGLQTVSRILHAVGLQLSVAATGKSRQVPRHAPPKVLAACAKIAKKGGRQ